MQLKNLRNKIDALDQRIVRLLNARARACQQIGRLKSINSASVYAPEREKAILDRLQQLNGGPVSHESLQAIYREIMSSSLSLEKPLSIAYLGPEYTFSHQASIKKFGNSVRYVPCIGINDVFKEVETYRCDYGLVPVENSIEGAIYHTLDCFINSPLSVCAEVMLPIRLCLLSKEKKMGLIKRVYSNPQVFGQCRHWMESHLPKAEQIAEPSTTQSAQRAASQKNAACIASELAARPNKLNVLASSIQDTSTNVTRFLVLAHETAKPTRSDKTSLMISIKDIPGALQRVLRPFEQRKINLSKIVSRPSKRKEWEYFFFIDAEAHQKDPRFRTAIKSIEPHTTLIKVLGSYPKA